jgi:MOSC domain-containing protein
MMSQPTVSSLYRYPVKGLSPQRLAQTRLEPGQTVPADRLYAIENGPSGFDPAAPAYFPKIRFLMLMRDERLAALRTVYDEASHTIHIHWEGREAARGDLRTPEGRAEIERFLTAYCAGDLRGPAKVLSGEGPRGRTHSFSDVAKKVVSIINLASVADVETLVGAPVHPLRFRGNIYVDGWPAWHEFDLLGREMTIGGARVKVLKRIVRCAATEVDPDTGVRDLKIPQLLLQNLGHADCGVYAEVVGAGEIAAGDRIALT